MIAAWTANPFALAAVATLYFPAVTIATRTTLGKYMLGIGLMSSDPEHPTPSAGRLLLRETVGRFVSAIWFGVGYWMALNSPQRQTWSDRMGHTFVVRKSTPPVLRAALALALLAIAASPMARLAANVR